MIDDTLVSAVRDRLRKLISYRKQVRPPLPTSFPPYVDSELQRIDTTTRDIVAGLQALDPILEALTVDQGAAFPEAPVDGIPYARQDAGWTPLTAIKGEPGEPGRDGVNGKDGAAGKDGTNGTNGQDGAPGKDGINGKDGTSFPDAPSDGFLYARKDGTWTAFEPGTGEGGGGSGDLVVKPTATGPSGHLTARPTHPYWRILVARTNGDGYVTFAELEFRQKAGVADQATGGSSADNGNYSGDYSAAKAFDANMSTCFHSGGQSNVWVSYRFPAARSVEEVAITSRAEANGVRGSPNTFDIQWSDDGATWTTEWTVTGATFTGFGQTIVFSNTSPGTSARDMYPTALAALNDVDMSTSPQAGQVLVYDGNEWKPATPASGGGGGGVDNEFAAVVFEATTASGGSTPTRILASKNVKAVTRLSAGRYKIDFATQAADVDRLVPCFAAWFPSYSNTAPLTMVIDRNSDQLAGMGLTAASCVITALGTTGYDARRVTARFTTIA